MGKCLSADAKIVLDDGSVTTIEDLRQAEGPSDDPRGEPKFPGKAQRLYR